MQPLSETAAHLLEQYRIAKEERHRFLFVVGSGPAKLYFAALSGFLPEREAATRFQQIPLDIAAAHPGSRIELA